MGYGTRQPTPNDIPQTASGESPWLEITCGFDLYALKLAGLVRNCAGCHRPTSTKHLDADHRCPDCRPQTS